MVSQVFVIAAICAALLPLESDSTVLDLAARRVFGPLLAAGVRIFQSRAVVHTKVLAVDDAFVSIGSYNFDHRSLAYNLEMVVNVLDDAHLPAIFVGDDSCWVVRHAGENGDLVASRGPHLRQLAQPGLRCADLGWKVVRDDENAHYATDSCRRLTRTTTVGALK